MAFEAERSPSLHRYSLISDWLGEPRSREVLERFIEQMNGQISDPISLSEQSLEFLGDFPLIKLIQLYGQEILQERSPESVVDELLALAHPAQV